MDIKEIKGILKNYCAQPALSGHEERMAKAFSAEIEKYCDEVRIDKLGNVIGTISGTDQSAPSVMVLAHMDNIGFLVQHIYPAGLMRVERVGGVADKVLQGHGVVVGNDKNEYFEGTFATQSYGANTAKDRVTVNPLSELFVDIGVTSDDEVKALGINVGCPVMFDHVFLEMANDRVVGSFMDNRAGCTAVTSLAKKLSENRPKCTVHIVGTVWEEFNLRGASIATRTAKTDIAISVNAGMTSDTHETKNTGNVRLGGGPIATLFNFHGRGTLNGCIPQKGLYELAKKVSREKDIPMQRWAGRGVITDTAYVQLEGNGIPSIDINVPLRYAHSPSEVVDLKDIETTACLIFEMINSIDSGYDLNRY